MKPTTTRKALACLLAIALMLPLGATALAASPVKQIEVMVSYRDIDDLYFNEMPYYNDQASGITAQSGVRATFTQVKESDWTTKLNLMLASGEYPDIIMRGAINLEMYGVDQEILIPLDDYIDQYMPIYKERLEADPALAQTLRSSDGKMYQIGWLIPQNINTDSHLFINKQWLDNLGLALPTTLEEYETVLRAFKEQDANGNGDPNDEIPFGGTYKAMVDGMAHLFSFWGVPFNDRYISIGDDQVVSSPLLNANLRAAVETLHRWYAEGLIDIEAVAQDSNAFEAKVNAEQYGSFWRWRMTALGTASDIAAKYVCLVPFSANGIQPQLPRYLEIPTFGAAITANCKDIEAACKWLDTQLQWDNMINGYNGMFEESWIYEDDGKVTILPMFDGTRAVPGQSSMYYMDGANYFAKVNMPSHRIEKSEYCAAYEAAGAIEKNSWHTLTKVITPNVEESERIALLYAEIQKYADEAMTSFIVKGVTDDSWNAYTKTLGDLKIDQYISLYQQAYDRYLEANK